MIHYGDCVEVLKTFTPNFIDALVTDPPAGISFMNKSWDTDRGGREEWIAWMRDVMRECLRVMKPGAHGLVWAIPRTSHWTGTALEQAGFEVRDVVTHLFGSGFPKSLDISKAIDKAAGAEREVAGPNLRLGDKKAYDKNAESKTFHTNNAPTMGMVTKPATPEAKKWEGWGTALKPACEFWFLIRKPCSESTVAKNVLKWGTGGINIDAGRIEGGERPHIERRNDKSLDGDTYGSGINGSRSLGAFTKGRFPANLVLSCDCPTDQHDLEVCAVGMLDEQSGYLVGCGNKLPKIPEQKTDKSLFGIGGDGTPSKIYDRGGGASRFFYVAKASKREKNAGLEETLDTIVDDGRNTPIDNPYLRGKTGRKNTHPTVKPTKLMEYLIKLITPPNGTVLDPFMGSGSTGIAAERLGFQFIGIEKELPYFEIAKLRILDTNRKIQSWSTNRIYKYCLPLYS